jgi:tagatose-1,6-bisphosphate aldolase
MIEHVTRSLDVFGRVGWTHMKPQIVDSNGVLSSDGCLHGRAAWAEAVARNRPDRRVRVACDVPLLCWLVALGLARLIGYR